VSSRALNLVSAFTSSLLASLRFVVAADLAVILLWALVEIWWSVEQDREYSRLHWLLAVTLVSAVGATAWRCADSRSFGLSTAATDGLNVLPLAFLDLGVLLVAVLVSDQLEKPLRTPLLRLSQTLFHLLFPS
jgi:hypothetical protein